MLAADTGPEEEVHTVPRSEDGRRREREEEDRDTKQQRLDTLIFLVRRK